MGQSDPVTPSSDEASPSAGRDGDENLTGVVTWIADGDTIEIDSGDGAITVRLIAINTPEEGECFADAARDHLIDTLDGESVRVEAFGTDQFDRTLGHVFAGDRHINLEMVVGGWSLASTPGEDDPYGERILTAEEDAYSDGTGLWAPDACGDHDALPEVAIDPGESEPDPPGHDDLDLEGETLTLTSESSTGVDLGGWILRDESARHRYVFPEGTSISGKLVVSSAEGEWDPGDSPVWNNGGDMALLQLADGTVVSRWRY